MPGTLEVFLLRHCPSERSARHLIVQLQETVPSCRVEVHPVRSTRATELGITIAPSFVLDGHLIAVGVPAKDWLETKVRERLSGSPPTRSCG